MNLAESVSAAWHQQHFVSCSASSRILKDYFSSIDFGDWCIILDCKEGWRVYSRGLWDLAVSQVLVMWILLQGLASPSLHFLSVKQER